MNNTLSNKVKANLIHQNKLPDHQKQFVHKWIDLPEIPQHIQHILTLISEMSMPERQKVYFYKDQLYYVDPRKTMWIKKRGSWEKSKNFAGYGHIKA